jgi:hypothetical protein
MSLEKPVCVRSSLVVLTWKAPLTLENTLKSLVPLLAEFDESLVICQESDPEEMYLALKYGFKPIGTKENIGIQNGLKKAVQSCAYNQILLLENDCELICCPKEAAQAIRIVREQLALGKIDYAKVGSMPMLPRKRFRKYWRFENQTLRRRLFGWLRYTTADSVASEIVSLPLAKGYKSKALREICDGFYMTNSQFCPWSNRSLYLNKKFFLEYLIPFAEANPTSRTCNGMPELEHRINNIWKRGWWRSQHFKIGILKPGLFGHTRVDRTSSDSKWLNGGYVESSAVSTISISPDTTVEK